MTGGAGFSRDAMISGQSNRANRTSNRPKFQDGQSLTSSKKRPMRFKEVSEEKLERIKRDFQAKRKKERTQNLIIGLVLATLLIVAVLLLFF